MRSHSGRTEGRENWKGGRLEAGKPVTTALVREKSPKVGLAELVAESQQCSLLADSVVLDNLPAIPNNH